LFNDSTAESTFIILDKELPDSPATGFHGGCMVGDVNLFWNDLDDESAVEIEIMIAEPRVRRKGLATESLRLFMAYAATELVIGIYGVDVSKCIPIQEHSIQLPKWI